MGPLAMVGMADRGRVVATGVLSVCSMAWVLMGDGLINAVAGVGVSLAAVVPAGITIPPAMGVIGVCAGRAGAAVGRKR